MSEEWSWDEARVEMSLHIEQLTGSQMLGILRRLTQWPTESTALAYLTGAIEGYADHRTAGYEPRRVIEGLQTPMTDEVDLVDIDTATIRRYISGGGILSPGECLALLAEIDELRGAEETTQPTEGEEHGQ